MNRSRIPSSPSYKLNFHGGLEKSHLLLKNKRFSTCSYQESHRGSILGTPSYSLAEVLLGMMARLTQILRQATSPNNSYDPYLLTTQQLGDFLYSDRAFHGMLTFSHGFLYPGRHSPMDLKQIIPC